MLFICHYCEKIIKTECLITFTVLGAYYPEQEKYLTSSTEKIYTLKNGVCHKIKINYAKSIGKGSCISIQLVFNESISFEDLPDLDFYMTSEKNSYGIVYNEWMDGAEEKFSFEKGILWQETRELKVPGFAMI